MAAWLVGSKPPGSRDKAMPQWVCRCNTQAASGRAACTAPWMAKPVGLTGCGESSSLSPRTLTFTKLLAHTSSNSRPNGLMR